MEYNKSAILKTLLYSDIFGFPLTRGELWEYLVSSKKINKEVFENTLKTLTEESAVFVKDNYYSLKGSEKNIEKRKSNLKEVEKKLLIAKQAARYLSFIPTIKLLGISGGLAMKDADKDDDIDFFIITKKNTVFLTRIWVLGILEILGKRRKHTELNPADKICINLIIDESKNKWSLKNQDVYTAHEIAQLKLLFERDGMYRKFIKSNKWINKYFPNAKCLDTSLVIPSVRLTNFFQFAMHILEINPVISFIGWVQLAYIKRHRTRENVSKAFLAFHPHDYRVYTLNKLRLKSQQLGLLTKF